ncbi:MAG TPA: flagellar hook-length control protein FliK, partial [Pseudomonas sp.]|nr:flagellar hook-length control protein FliK [Pseudomonas sp.]
PLIADSGKPLPTEPVLDPLLLLGMTGQLQGEDQAADPALEGEASVGLLPASVLGLSVPVPVAQDAAQDEVVAMPPLPLSPTLESAGKTALAASQAQQQVSPGALAAQTSLNAGQNFAGALAAMAGEQLPPAGEGEVDLLPSDLSLDGVAGLENLKESVGESRFDSSRLGALGQAMTQQPTPTQRAALIPGMPVPMQQGAWSEAVVDRVMWLSSQNLKSAEIQLDPAELGRLEVRISVNQDQTQVSFASPNAQVREALDGQMHRLRELFSQQGMNQLDVSVSDQSLNRGWQGQGGDERGGGRRGQADGAGNADEPLSLGVSEVRSGGAAGGRGLVDYYA